MRLSSDAQLQASPEFRIGVGVPAPLSARLDGLVELANASGAGTNRKELLAALLLDAVSDGRDLAELVRRYRTATVVDAVIAGQPEARYFDPERPPPGPRPRRGR